MVLGPPLGVGAAGDGEGHGRLLGEVVAGAAADPGHAVGEIEVLEGAAVREGVPADAGDAGGELHRGEARAVVECVHAHGGELAALGEDGLGEVGALVQRPVGEAGHAGRDVELLDEALERRPRLPYSVNVALPFGRTRDEPVPCERDEAPSDAARGTKDVPARTRR